jgi:hypothetical protein
VQRIFPADKPQRASENTAAKPAEAEAAAKAGEVRATFSKASRVSAEDALAVLDAAIAEMVSEGGPTR